MTRVIQISGIDCELKKVRKSRHLRISVHQDGRVVITAPFYESYKSMEQFALEHADWIAKRSSVRALGPKSEIGTRAHYIKHREQARLFIARRLRVLNQSYGFKYNKVRVTNAKTRWGSCSSRANLSFSYRLLFLSPELADYVIVHELCHLKEMNHSKRFWELVLRSVSCYKEYRRKLKKLVL